MPAEALVISGGMVASPKPLEPPLPGPGPECVYASAATPDTAIVTTVKCLSSIEEPVFFFHEEVTYFHSTVKQTVQLFETKEAQLSACCPFRLLGVSATLPATSINISAIKGSSYF